MFSQSILAVVLFAPTVSVRVEGPGYLRFVRDGRTVYAKETVLAVKSGAVVGKDGLPIMPRIQVLGDPESLRIEEDGRIYGIYQGSERLLGKTLVAVFADDVRPVEDKGWLVSSARATTGQAGSEGFGRIVTQKPSPDPGARPLASVIPTVTLRRECEVNGASFTLGDIADIEAPQDVKDRIASCEVATTPAFGVNYTMTADMIKTRLRRYGALTESLLLVGEPSVTVARKGQRVTNQMFIDRAMAEAQSRGISAGPLSDGLQTPDMVVPEGLLALTVTAFETTNDRIEVRVQVVVAGKPYNGRLVTLTRKQPSIDLKVGQTVKLLVRSNAAVVETTGKVKSIDKASGLVTVLSATGATVTGRAVGTNTVEVSL